MRGTSESSSFQRASVTPSELNYCLVEARAKSPAAGSNKDLHVRASFVSTRFPPGASATWSRIREVTLSWRNMAGVAGCWCTEYEEYEYVLAVERLRSTGEGRDEEERDLRRSREARVRTR
jgi:hypothetical protein